MCGRVCCLGLAVVLLATACTKDAAEVSTTTTFKTTMTGANEVPAVTTNGTGTATIVVDNVTKNLTYTYSYTGLSSNVTLAHIHGPIPPGQNAGVILSLNPTTGVTAATVGPVTVSLTTALTGTINADSLIKIMNAGQAYVNVHTATNGGGEIRGWLVKQ